MKPPTTPFITTLWLVRLLKSDGGTLLLEAPGERTLFFHARVLSQDLRRWRASVSLICCPAAQPYRAASTPSISAAERWATYFDPVDIIILEKFTDSSLCACSGLSPAGLTPSGNAFRTFSTFGSIRRRYPRLYAHNLSLKPHFLAPEHRESYPWLVLKPKAHKCPSSSDCRRSNIAGCISLIFVFESLLGALTDS